MFLQCVIVLTVVATKVDFSRKHMHVMKLTTDAYLGFCFQAETPGRDFQ